MNHEGIVSRVATEDWLDDACNGVRFDGGVGEESLRS